MNPFKQAILDINPDQDAHAIIEDPETPILNEILRELGVKK